MYIEKSMGDNMGHCGTKYFSLCGFNIMLLIIIEKVLISRNLSFHFMAVSEIPI